MLLCWLLPTVLLGTFIGLRFFGAMQEKTEAFLTTGAQQAQVRTLENIDKMVALAKSAVYDGDLAAAVSSYESGKINLDTYFRLCRGYLESKYGRETLCDFALFFTMAEPSTLFYTADDYPEVSYFLSHAQLPLMKLSGLTVRGHINGKDGIYAATLLVEMLSVTGRKLSELTQSLYREFGQTYMAEYDWPFDREMKESLQQLLLVDKKLPQFPVPVQSVNYMDGCKVLFENGWIIARFSGTEPLLRVFCEMPTQREAHAIATVMAEFLGLRM